MKAVGVGLSIVLLLGACAEKDEFSDSTLPPISSDQIAAATTTTTVPLVPATLGPKTPAIVGDVCELSVAPNPGSSIVTYMLGGSLMALTPDGTQAACIMDNMVAPPGPVIWGPDGNSVLMGPGTMRNVFGAFPTGIADNDPTVRWTYPAGEFLLSLHDGRLDRRKAGEARSRRSLGVMSKTTAVASHPAGEHLLIGGVGRDRVTGIYIANIDGRNARPIVTVPTPDAVVTAISVAPSGDQFGFVAAVGERSEVFIGRFPDLTLTRILDVNVPLDTLVQSSSGALAVRAGNCDGRVTTYVYPGDQAVDIGTTGPLAELSASPIGWTDATHLVVMARANGCAGPGDLWVVDPADPYRAELLVSAVDSAALRSGAPQALPIDGSLAPNPTPADLA